ncbi:MAG TPA: SDR family NAD(P)-dependent oxidoreductase, partial [Thermoanaerobaculia bacterium]|nr:SDR family NAD(P)-dependent oxidoreductase [Thermoanaerobaculia bacterium]
LDIVLNAAMQARPGVAFDVARIAWPQPLVIDGPPPELTVTFRGDDFTVTSERGTHARGTLAPSARAVSSTPFAMTEFLERAMGEVAKLTDRSRVLLAFEAEGIEIFDHAGDRTVARAERIDARNYRLILTDERGRVIVRFRNIALSEAAAVAPMFRVVLRESAAIAPDGAFIAREDEASLHALREKLQSRPERLTVFANGTGPYVAAQAAFARAASRELPGITVLAPEAQLEPISIASSATPFRDGGSYLIAGGAGTIGFDLSLHLASRHHARITWLGRRPIDDDIRARIERVRAAGGEATYVCADVTRDLDAAIAACGPLHGVIHAALVLRTLSIDELSADAFDEVFLPKAGGVENLLRAVEHQPLDFFLVVSSIQSFTTDARQGAYAAASAYVDAFARSARAPFPIRTVNLGYWRGGPLSSETMQKHIESMGHRLLDPAAAIDALSRAIASDEPQIAIADRSPVVRDGVPPREPARTPEFAAYVRGRVARALRGVDRARVLPKYARLLNATGAFEENDAPLPHDRDLDPWVRMLDAVLPRYAEVLTGERSAAEVMLPGGSMEMVEGVYRGQAVADYFQRATAEAVRAYVSAHLRDDAPIAILEAGAGTGATTRFILDALAPFAGHFRYTFTDLSRAFLKNAPDGVEPAVLDLERDAREQGFASGAYDVVIAANVVHATRDIRRSLRNLRELLRPGGALILNEATDVQDVLTATFGLLDGWWLFDDVEHRLPHSPLLGADTWRRLLAEEIGAVVVSSDRNAEEEGLGQRVFVAQTAQNVDIEVEPVIARCVAEVLEMRVDDVPRETPFADYGMDSILGIEMIERVRKALGVDIRATAIFDYPSVRKLASHLAPLGPPASAPAGTATSRRRPDDDDSVAIIGFSGRFPGAANSDEYWRNLANGICSIREVPPERWRADASACRWGGFLDDVDAFDPLFFNISGSEARLMDPQQRLFLMECWRALEDGGYAPSTLAGTRCGVFAGAVDGDYRRLLESAGESRGAQWLTGNDSAVLASRIAYFLDLKGPTLSINAACASSLTAVHLACRAILAGDADLMLAGGVYVATTPDFFIHASSMGMLSPTGECRAFDARANGFVPGEGAGAVLLKRHADALRDGDTIHGVIRASAINQDGRTNGITAPSATSQRDVELEVYRRVHPDSIQYVETHGTGTALGDPVEMQALTDAFRAHTTRRNFCAIGSVKTNIGHATLAAGIASVIKILMALRHRALPPSLGFAEPNPRIDFERSPFFVNRELRPWESDGPRRAAISGFGFNGSNCHIVIEEPPRADVEPEADRLQLIPISARDEEALQRRVSELASWLRRERPALADVAFTLQHRATLERRVALAVSSTDELIDRLDRQQFDAAPPSVPPARGRRIALPLYPFARDRYWPVKANDHKVFDQEILPGAAVLEMIAAEAPCKLSGVAWHKPLVVTSRADVEKVIAGDRFEIRSGGEVHASGAIARCATTPDRTSLDAIRARCTRVIAPDAIYAKLRESGIEHGPSFRTLVALSVSNDEALGEIACDAKALLPAAAVDGAFQALAGLTLDDFAPLMPFALDELEVFAPLRGRVFAHVRRRAATRYDLDLRDADGALLARFRDLAFRPAAQPRTDSHAYVPRWVPSPATTTAPRGKRAVVFGLAPDALRSAYDTLVIDAYPDVAPDDIYFFTPDVVAFFRCVREMSRREWRDIRLVVATSDAAVHGFARSLAKERHDWRVVVVADFEGDARHLLDEPGEPDGAPVTYRNGARHILVAEPMTLPQAPSRFRRNGVYLIAGGLGAVGEHLTRYLRERYDARVVRIGRRALLEDDYLRADITNPAEIRDAVRATIARHGALHGVIHSALVLADRTIDRMDEELLRSVLSPKVEGSRALCDAVAGLDLDFLLFFSSAQSFLGNAGQSNYAAASAAQDAIALGHDRAKVVNWGDWGATGAASGDVRAHIARAGGLPIGVDEALDALERFLASDLRQLIYVKGEPRLMKRLGVSSNDTLARLRTIFAESLSLRADQIDPRATFDRYGVDSLAVLDLNKRIEHEFGRIPSTLLFERNTLESLAAHFAPRVEVVERERAPITHSDDDVAIIGVSGRYPLAPDLDSFWSLLRDGRSGIREIPPRRWRAQQYASRWGGFLDDIDRFDPLFFNIAPSEAEAMDPQERLFLETAWAAIEDAGYTRAALTSPDARV